ncbi:hypothetical protein [Nesterenkonia populi]|uniref:hypothetical protein n=1 Tax=Nesterenkonia populi TaxID=1591087 RepID=UPI0011BEA257|nr:hypothetical protein [Nesterenkonia populi]
MDETQVIARPVGPDAPAESSASFDEIVSSARPPSALRVERDATEGNDDPLMTPKALEGKKLLTNGVRRRRSVPIMGYIGLNGQGKTLAMVRDTLPSLMMGRRILSTVTILDPDTGQPHPLFEPFVSWDQLHDFRDGDVLLDEVTGAMDSGDSLPKDIRRLLPQMRRRNVMIRWTGIDWDNSNKRLRQVTQAVARCKGLMKNHKVIRQQMQAHPDVAPMWAPNRLFVVNTFDAQAITSGQQAGAMDEDRKHGRKARILNREIYWGPRSPGFQCYDTGAEVAQITADCPTCGGKIPETRCKGH